MPKLRSTEAKPQPRKAAADPKARLSSRQSRAVRPQAKSGSGKADKKNPPKGGVVRLHLNEDQPPLVTRPVPWWVFPHDSDRGLAGEPTGPHGGYLGPGGLLPTPPPFPGPFLPPRPTVLWSSAVASPISGPGSPPAHQAYMAVRLTGGTDFPRVNYAYSVPYFPGITIRQTLALTGYVDYGPDGFIRNVAGLPVDEGIEVRLRVGGRIVPQTLLDAPAEPGGAIGLELYRSNVGAIPIPL
ncbi:hypothetical protein ACF3MZ_30815 [Paenibacillaceae bacterium WGS1546]|uniref:hypothetical protein n=1 Tax=Cohnella sp. WGS1546 TaxID=3366810 RepID=UPI00372CFC3E